MGLRVKKEDDTMNQKTETLGLRPMPPRESHEKIFMTWKLGLGETLKIINDHDPKPLHYQFEAEMPETYEWKYEGYTARNPKTGVRVEVALKALPFLKAGKEPHSGIHLIFC